MKTSDFNYQLPEELIAQTPLERRDGSRLMTLDRNTGAWEHHHFYELPEFLNPGDCLILNDSRVLPARLLGQRLPGGGACEVLLLIDRGEKTWECLVRPGRHMREGAKLSFGNGELTAEVTKVLPDGNRLVRFDYEGIFLEILEHLGKMPLPPYIKEELQDQERYQTVYSKVLGSAAAPTAGLHFTPELLEQIKAKGKVVVGTEAQYAPYEFKDLDANFAGCDMWLAQQIADSLGVELEVVDMAFDGIIPAVQSGQVDLGIAAFTNTPERAEEIDFSDLYETSAQLLIVKAGNADTYSTKESLVGLKVGAQKGTIQSRSARERAVRA